MVQFIECGWAHGWHLLLPIRKCVRQFSVIVQSSLKRVHCTIFLYHGLVLVFYSALAKNGIVVGNCKYKTKIKIRRFIDISFSKIITPAFHFKILEEFCLIFDSQSEILLNNLKKHELGDAFDVTDCISLMALDVVCGRIL